MRVADESNSLTRKHYDWNAQLIVTYNTLPANPTAAGFASPPRSCASTTALYVNNGPSQPLSLQVTETDADGGNVSDTFYIYAANGYTVLHSYGTGFVAQGVEKIQIPAGTLPPGAYKWNAVGGDGTDLSAGYSPWCYFTVDNAGPALPTISLPAVSSGQSYTVGKPINVTIGSNPSDHVAMFAVWWATGPNPSIPITASGGVPSCATAPAVQTVQFVCPDQTTGTATVTVAPPNTQATLAVASYDLAGNTTTTTPHAATTAVTAAADTVAVADSAGHRWATDILNLSGAAPTSVPDVNTSSAEADLAVGTSPVWANADKGPSLSFPGSVPATTASAVVNTTQSFTVSACLTSTSTTTGTFTALSHGSGANSDFTLGVAGGKWQFCAHLPGSPATTKSDCAVGSAVTVNQSTFVTGTYDAVNHLVSISFAGSAAPLGSVSHVIPAGTSPTAGGLMVGADCSNGATADGWAGLVNDPSIYQGIAASSQLQNLALQYGPN